MPFLRIVELLPPTFDPRTEGPADFDVKAALDRFLSVGRDLAPYADLLLVADVKNPNLLKVSNVECASLLKEATGVETAPVIVARDVSRVQLRASVVTAVSKGVGTLMLAWGDPILSRPGVKKVYDFRGLSEVIKEAASIGKVMGSPLRILAPVDLRKLSGEAHRRMYRERLSSGAQFLLAQPPTADLPQFEAHLRLVEDSALADRVLLGVFPFYSVEDARKISQMMGWEVPESFARNEAGGRSSVLSVARSVVESIQAKGLPGVYLSLRRDPALAREVLGMPPPSE